LLAGHSGAPPEIEKVEGLNCSQVREGSKKDHRGAFPPKPQIQNSRQKPAGHANLQNSNTQEKFRILEQQMLRKPVTRKRAK